MEESNVSAYYHTNKEFYSRLGNNLEEAFRQFLIQRKIAFHNVNHRVKDFESFLEKIERKEYKDPQNQIEDFLGIRIICYYASDLELIENLIKEEFDVKEALDKVGSLESDRFGYRSYHYIVAIKENWCSAPNYRNLNGLKVEVQVRTILMHAWADIEHKLAYKSQDQVPHQFRRKLSQLSALLEIADQQFQILKNERDVLKANLIVEKNNKKSFDTDVELNLDTLQAYLDFAISNRSKGAKYTSELLDELYKFNISISEIDDYYSKIKNDIQEFEKELGNQLAQIGVVRFVLDIFNNQYWASRHSIPGNGKWNIAISKLRKKYNKDI